MEHLAEELRELVHESVRILGEVIRRELGNQAYERIESLRASMAKLRGVSREESHNELKKQYAMLERLSEDERIDIARAYTLMLEVMNACENAYRSHRIANRSLELPDGRPESIVYVLTAHPTEARSPENIAVFQTIVGILTKVVSRKPMKFSELEVHALRHSLEIAWKTPIVRERAPRVQDEAEHIYSTFLRDATLSTILTSARELAPIYIRSWVGGDKDGHPGVDEKVFQQSLQLSRVELLNFCRGKLQQVHQTLSWIGNQALQKELGRLESLVWTVSKVTPGDVGRIVKLRRAAAKFVSSYVEEVGCVHPALHELRSLLHIFPALVVPLEFREASDVLMGDPSGKSLAIFRMLKTLGAIAKGGDPRWYVRGFIVSMTSEIEHLEAAAHLTEKALGGLKVPVIPLFEQSQALRDSEKIVDEMLNSKIIKPAIKEHWNNHLEVMLGYSDSAKESGVLRSRLQVAETLYRLDKLCRERGVTPVFFHGSGGSTDRGGGSIDEQTKWWPAGALKLYKVTVQGEMVERSFATPEITRGQIERIVQASGNWREAEKHKFSSSPALVEFANKVAAAYQKTVHSEDFLQVIGSATPYPFLSLLRIGSRPTKRSSQVSVESLRAIPWILCWTQTRTLFPTWWGVGSAWEGMSREERKHVLDAASGSPVFKTYIRALKNTLAKVRLSVWWMYLEKSELEPRLKKKFAQEFSAEFDRANTFVQAISERSDALETKPWLEESIHLRSPMIHPLNLLQILAMRTRDESLLRLTVTGISSGMMTTG